MWKGLEPDKKPIFLSYDQTERMIAVLMDRAAAWQPDLVAGILRGGLVPATMAATILAKPLAVINYQRATGTVSWLGVPPAGQRVLLVDDGCSTGGTMTMVRNALVREGRDCLTLAAVYDPERTTFVPDLSHPMKSLWRFPWERGEATPAGQELRATGAGPDYRTEEQFAGLDLEVLGHGIKAIAAQGGHDAQPVLPSLPFFVPEKAILITGRPEAERSHIEQWLQRQGIAMLLECRPDSILHDARLLARYKASVALRHGCTHFFESDPAQAILISAAMPHLIVTWWPGHRGHSCVVSAATLPESADVL